jgi:hypothetical protein
MPYRLVTLAALLALSIPAPAADPPAQDKGLFVAVGYGGRRITTTDGVAWANDVEDAADGGDDNNCLFSVCFAQNKFVAVGGGGGRGRILVTADGKDWREVKAYRFRVNPVLYGNGIFLAGTGKQFESSVDGETWATAGKIDTKGGPYFRHGAFGNGTFVFCGDISNPPPPDAPKPQPGDKPRPRDGWRCATKDGKTVDALHTDLPCNQLSIAFGNGRFVMAGKGGFRQSSADGVAWADASDKDEDFRSVFFTGKQFVLNGKRDAYTSDDGVKWTKAGKSFNATPLAAAGANGRFVGASWKTAKYASDDGLTWRVTDKGGTNALTSAAYGVPKP